MSSIRKPEAEKAFLSCCLLDADGEVINLATEKGLSVNHIHSDRHRILYQHLFALHAQTGKIDYLLVRSELVKTKSLEKVGGDDYLKELLGTTTLLLNAAKLVDELLQSYALHQLAAYSKDTVKRITDGEAAPSIIESLERNIYKLIHRNTGNRVTHIDSPVMGAMAAIHRQIKSGNAISGVPTGIRELDKLTTGFHPAEMIVVAARPSMGKTALGLNMLMGALRPKFGAPTNSLMFSLEMPKEQLMLRLIASDSGVSMNAIRNGNISSSDIDAIKLSAARIQDLPLYIDDESGTSITAIRAKARRIAGKLGHLGLIVVDYLQLVAGSDQRMPREQQIAEISSGMKGMAKEIGCPVIALAQLNRESEKEKRTPRLSDLRESGSIEQDADVVIMISRKPGAEPVDESKERHVERQLILTKQRNGPVGEIDVSFDKWITKFSDQVN